MFNLAARAQAIGNNALTAVSCISVAVAVLSFLQLYAGGAWRLSATQIANVRASASLKNSRSFGADGTGAKENARITFDLAADLRPLFNWNTKQVFVYLTAQYDGAQGPAKVTFWDKIITSERDAVVAVHAARSKYSVWDLERSFGGRNATLRLEWNVQPWVGALLYGETDTASTFSFAPTKSKKKPAA